MFVIVLAGLFVLLGISKSLRGGSYFKLAFSKASKPSKSKGSNLKYSNEKVPTPTPLMISPEEVKNYDDRPWRPFRWPYHQTMSIFKLDINHWLDMDKYYWHYIEEKKRIYLEYGKENIDWLPEAYDACLELMETVSNHMLVRYPLLFSLIEDKGCKGKVIKNELTGDILDMSYPLQDHPLLYVSKMAKEDFYIVLNDPKTKVHYLGAAAVPFPGGSFGISAKIGKHLDAIHEEVPYYHEKLKKSMEKWFGRLTAGDPVERASWYISWDHKLKLNNVYRIPKQKKGADSRDKHDLSDDWENDLKSADPRQFNVRVERQTLRRLPRTRAIIFTNHPVFYSIEEMKDEPMIPSLIKKIIYEGPRDIIKYKNFELFRDHISKYLDGLIERQLAMGIINENTPLKTQPSYPFAHWVKTDFDFINGWCNPSYKKKFDYSEVAKQEKKYGNE